MSGKAFPRDSHLTSIAIAYKNPEVNLVADQVFPRVRVGKREFSYIEYPLAEMYSIPETRTGERTQLNRVEVTGSKVTGNVEDRGIVIPLTKSDIDNAAPNANPKDRATERATNIMLIDRERDAANLAFNPASYPDSQKKNLASGGNLRLDAENAKPLLQLRQALDSCLVRPNRILFGQAVWSKFSAIPEVVSAALGNSGTSGFATRERIAELLEVNQVLVGAAWANSVKPGKTPVLTRLWGNGVLAYYFDPTVDTSGGITFGITAQYGERVAGSKEVEMGVEGGVEVMAGEITKEVIVAPHAAFYFYNAVTLP